MLAREFAVRLLQIGIRHVLPDAEDGVEVFVEPVLTGHAPSGLSRDGGYSGDETATRAARMRRSPSR
jgi:hypothetical protein